MSDIDQFDIAETPDAPGSNHLGPRMVRWVTWAVCVLAFAVFATVMRVHTRLGVEAYVWDKDGSEYVWRVWWRARDDMIQVNPSWAFSAVLVALLALFVGLSALAFWLALVAEDRSPAGKSTANAPSE